MTPIQTRLLGESVREIGVLTLVFVPLDMLLEWKNQEQHFKDLPLTVINPWEI